MITSTQRLSPAKLYLSVAAAAVLAVTACAPEETAEFEDGEAAAQTQPASPEPTEKASPGPTVDDEPEESEEPQENNDDEQDVVYGEVDDPVTFDVCEDAEADDDATVTWLDDVVQAEEHFEGLAATTAVVNGEEIEIPGAPAAVIPERVGQAGCIIEYDAPANCMAEVEISGAYIPGFSVPERKIPEVELPDGTVLEELVMPAEEEEAQHIEGSHHEEVCQIDDDLEEADSVSSVSRGSISRASISQSSVSQSSESRPSINTDSGDYISGTYMSGTYASGLFVSGVYVPGDYMAGYRVEGTDHTERSGEEAVSYTTEGDVLFDSDEYELRSDAESELQAIADDIAERSDDFEVTVEGHTDDLPTSVYDDNYELSELRAESVVDWLIDNADVDEDTITAEGLGEDYPRADNDTDEGRQQNRRVVITVTPEDYEPTVDYELED